MNNEYKMVPVDLLRSALGAVEYLALRGDDIGTSNVPIADALRDLLAAAPQPPALGGELVSLIIRDLCETVPAFGTDAVHLQVSELEAILQAHLAPLQAEIARLKYDLGSCELMRDIAYSERDQLKARRDELEKDRETLEYLMRQFEVEVCVCDRCYDEKEMKDSDSANYLRQYLSKPAGSGQV